MRYRLNKIPLFFVGLAIAIIGVGFYSSLNNDPISPAENTLVSTAAVMIGWFLLIIGIILAFNS